MTDPTPASTRKKPLTISLGPRGARLLGGYALLAMHGWFIIKFALPSDGGVMELVVGLAALTGMLASVTFFVCTYGVLANSPDDMLDEWQVSERNRAYFGAFKYLVGMILLGSIGSEICAKLFRFELSVAIMQNYLLLMLVTALVLPASLMAWRDTTPEHD